MALKPLADKFLFTFCSDTQDGRFIEKNSGSIILTNKNLDDQGKHARWGRVVAVGTKVTSFKEGDLVLIESLRWTQGFKYEGQQLWQSYEGAVCAIGTSDRVQYAY